MFQRRFYFLLLLAFVSCQTEPEKPLGPEKLNYSMDTLLLGDAETAGISFQVEQIIIEDSLEVAQTIQAQIQEHLVQNNVNFDEEFQTYQALFESLQKEREALKEGGYESPAPWDLQQGVEVFLNQNGLFGLRSYHSSYTGGAHPNYYRSSLLYRLSDGAELKLDSIVQHGELEKLSALAEAKLRLTYSLEENATINSAGFWFEENTFRLSSQFSYQPQGLSIYYNPYEIGPYSMGMIEIFIPYGEISDLIRPEYRFEAEALPNS